MRTAIQTRVEDEGGYRAIPAFVPGAPRPSKRDLSSLLRRHLRQGKEVAFDGSDDDEAFKRLLAGLPGIAPIEVEGYLTTAAAKATLPPPPSGTFEQGHGLVIGVAKFPGIGPLPEAVLKDARDLGTLLTNPVTCGSLTFSVTLPIASPPTQTSTPSSRPLRWRRISRLRFAEDKEEMILHPLGDRRQNPE